MHRNNLLRQLSNYRTPYLDEAAHVARAVRFIKDNPQSFNRYHFPVHVSGSAWVVNPSRTATLLMHHKKHNRWLQPGGHADDDPDLIRVALKETAEETGINPQDIYLLSPQIFDVDIHTLPERECCPRHQHIDIRYLIEIDDALPVPGNDESHELRWVPLHAIPRFNNSLTMRRMAEKTRRYLSA